MPLALRIQGRVGKYSHINDTYEPMQITHNDRPVWVARSVQPCYIFHSGKSRWCISKAMDDGARCWAYISAEGEQEPHNITKPWTCSDGHKEWNEDPKIQC